MVGLIVGTRVGGLVGVDAVGLTVGTRVGGLVGDVTIGFEVGAFVGSLVGADVTFGPAMHGLPFSEIRTMAYAGLALVSMLSTLTVMVLPSIVPLQLPPALSFASKEDSA